MARSFWDIAIFCCPWPLFIPGTHIGVELRGEEGRGRDVAFSVASDRVFSSILRIMRVSSSGRLRLRLWAVSARTAFIIFIRSPFSDSNIGNL